MTKQEQEEALRTAHKILSQGSFSGNVVQLTRILGAIDLIALVHEQLFLEAGGEPLKEEGENEPTFSDTGRLG